MTGSCFEYCKKIIAVEATVDNIKDWQKSQNGAIFAVNNKLDKLIFWLMVFGSTIAVSLLGTVISLLVVLYGKP